MALQGRFVDQPSGARWDQITAPTSTLSLTMPAGDETTFTVQSTTQTGFAWTSSTLTSGMLAAMTLTGSSAVASAANSGSLLTLTSSTTGFTAATQSLMFIRSSGANTNASAVIQGLSISIVNTGTTNTNTALALNSSGAITNNSLEIVAGRILSDAAQTWIVPATTASALSIGTAGGGWLILDTRAAFNSGGTFQVSGIAQTGDASTSSLNPSLRIFGATHTTTTQTTFNFQGTDLSITGSHLAQNGGAVTVTTASTLFITHEPIANASVTITNSISANILSTQTAGIPILATGTHASYTGTVIQGSAVRAANSAYNLLNLLSGANADGTGGTAKFTVRGDGLMTSAGNVVFSGLAAAGAGTAIIIDGSNNIIPLASSAAFKQNIRPLAFDSARILDLSGRSFAYNSHPDADTFGWIAEEVSAIMPEMVNLKDGKPYSVNYMLAVVPLVEEVKKLRTQILMLKEDLRKAGIAE